MEGFDSGRGMAGDNGITNDCFRCPMVSKPFSEGEEDKEENGAFSQEAAWERRFPDEKPGEAEEGGREGGGNPMVRGRQETKSGGERKERTGAGRLPAR